MKTLIIIFLMLNTGNSFAQDGPSVTVMDFVKIKNDNQKEAIFYYENNWKVYREIAYNKGYIKSYKVLSTMADSIADFDIVLMTEYKDSTQLNMAEERFQLIIKERRPNGPLLLNGIKATEFRQIIFNKKSKTLFESAN